MVVTKEDHMNRRTTIALLALCFAVGTEAALACSKDQVIKWTDERACRKADGTTGTQTRTCLTLFCPKTRSEQHRCMDWGACG
jgi:hypothetical protein